MADIKKLYSHFQETLDAANFDQHKVIEEWIGFQLQVSKSVALQKHNAAKLWERILQHKRDKFPNLCLLVQINICISGSNSSVQHAFSSFLEVQFISWTCLQVANENVARPTAINKRCNNKHATTHKDQWWPLEQRWEILIEHALDIYIKKCRKVTLKATDQPLAKESRPGITEEEQVLITSDEDNDTESISSWWSKSDVED